MATARKVSIELSQETVEQIEAEFESGEYETIDEVVSHALTETYFRRPEVAKRVRALVQQALDEDDWVEGGFDVEDIKRRGRERLANETK